MARCDKFSTINLLFKNHLLHSFTHSLIWHKSCLGTRGWECGSELESWIVLWKQRMWRARMGGDSDLRWRVVGLPLRWRQDGEASLGRHRGQCGTQQVWETWEMPRRLRGKAWDRNMGIISAGWGNWGCRGRWESLLKGVRGKKRERPDSIFKRQAEKNLTKTENEPAAMEKEIQVWWYWGNQRKYVT